MEDLDRKKLGKILRERRKEKKQTLENLSDELLSPATMSKIERGSSKVSLKKIEIFCNRLNYNLKKAPTLSGVELQTKEEQENELNQVRLTMIDNYIHSYDYKSALKELKEIALDDTNPYKAKVFFLKGCSYNLKGKTDEAKKCFYKTIHFVENQSKKFNLDNIKAHCYLKLCQIAYFRNDFKLALQEAKRGIKCFDDEMGNLNLKYALLENQVIYLELLGYRQQAFTLLRTLWKEKENIDNIDIILNMYDMQAKLLMRSQLYQDAIQYAKKGLKIAISNRNIGRAGELWVTLGDIYKRTNLEPIAFKSFLTAKEMLQKANLNQQIIEADVSLCELYNRRNQWRRTKKILEHSIAKIDENGPYLIRYIQALIILSESYHHLQELDKAEITYKKALDLSRQHELHKLEYEVLLKLVDFWERNYPGEENIYLKQFLDHARKLEKGGFRIDE